MDFLSLYFLFIFLPVFLTLYIIIPHLEARNVILLAASLVFYSMGEPLYFVLLIVLIALNYILGRLVQNHDLKILIWLGVLLNLSTLLLFKFLNEYSALFLQYIPESLHLLFDHIPYPLGLSYLSFQCIAYLIDISRKRHPAETNLFYFSLYIFLFPKILVGPITRYAEISSQLRERTIHADAAADGLRRFIGGLAKKTLIADQLGRVVGSAFAIPTPEFTTPTAWFVLFAYALQLYFDFSGYTDMALGLARFAGLTLPENFNFPYVSKSISEFWRRWHITLSAWFREYVFYPLERKRFFWMGQQINILLVFLLTGLWHGLTLPFIVWGLVHGLASAIESMGWGRRLKTLHPVVQHFYTLSVVLLGWVFFRSRNLSFAWAFLMRLFTLGGEVQPVPFSLSQPLPFIENSVWAAFVAGIIFAFPILPSLQKRLPQRPVINIIRRVATDLFLAAAFYACMVVILGASFKPGIYGGF